MPVRVTVSGTCSEYDLDSPRLDLITQYEVAVSAVHRKHGECPPSSPVVQYRRSGELHKFAYRRKCVF